MPTTARFYAAEICCVLEYLRQEGVVHRDLKVGAAVGDVYHNHGLSNHIYILVQDGAMIVGCEGPL